MELTNEVRDEAILLRRKNKMKLPDAIIAASAVIREAILLTNDETFSTIDGLSSESLQLVANT